MLNVIIFSKNRAPQLELLIRSLKRFFQEFSNFNIKILYTFTNSSFENGYNKLKNIHPDSNIIWKIEENFKKDLVNLFDKNNKYTVFFVDDNIFKEPFSIDDKEFKYFNSHGDILCLSLRLHPRLNYCYPASVKMTPPNFNENNVFNWMGQTGDYGYPMSLDGHIFRTRDLFFYILNMDYNGPNPLEAQMAMKPLFYPKMMCYNKSIIMNNPVNKVQEWNSNIHGNITSSFLNENFLNNKKIDLEPFIGFENTSCHQELPINFIEI